MVGCGRLRSGRVGWIVIARLPPHVASLYRVMAMAVWTCNMLRQQVYSQRAYHYLEASERLSQYFGG
jgi:hypothetical protein